MKLRNKKTGEVDVFECFTLFEPADDTDGADAHDEYYSLAELNEEWEDVEDTNILSKPSIEQRLEWLFKLTDEHDRRLTRIENDLDEAIDNSTKEKSGIIREPLIKDEKIRKAVRAWAEVNDANCARILGVGTLRCERTGVDIEFRGGPFLGWVTAVKTISELCGEEEECES